LSLKQLMVFQHFTFQTPTSTAARLPGNLQEQVPGCSPIATTIRMKTPRLDRAL